MKAALLYGKQDLRVVDVDRPRISENEVLLRVRCAAICGTDIRMYNNGSENAPIVPCHEVSGVIEEVGANVKRYRKGMRVAVAPNMGCGVCDFCASGRIHLCKEYRALGINENGGFTEFMRIPEAAVRQGNIIELDDGVSFDEAAINEPLSCVYNGFTHYEPKPGDNVLIIGAGPIGILHAKLCKMAGAARVMISDLSKERLEKCREIDKTFITIDDNLRDRVFELTDGRGVDVCVTACAAPSAQAQALELMAVGGRVSFFGGLPKDKETVPLNTNYIHYKELKITGSTRASVSQFRKTLELVSVGVLSVKELVSGRFALEDINAAFRLAANAKGMKSVICFD